MPGRLREATILTVGRNVGRRSTIMGSEQCAVIFPSVIECLVTVCYLLLAIHTAIDKDNQDQYCIVEQFGLQTSPSQWSLFAVFDGHGKYGTSCAQFAKQKVRSHHQLLQLQLRSTQSLVMNVYTSVELVMNVYIYMASQAIQMASIPATAHLSSVLHLSVAKAH